MAAAVSERLFGSAGTAMARAEHATSPMLIVEVESLFDEVFDGDSDPEDIQRLKDEVSDLTEQVIAARHTVDSSRNALDLTSTQVTRIHALASTLFNLSNMLDDIRDKLNM